MHAQEGMAALTKAAPNNVSPQLRGPAGSGWGAHKPVVPSYTLEGWGSTLTLPPTFQQCINGSGARPYRMPFRRGRPPSFSTSARGESPARSSSTVSQSPLQGRKGGSGQLHEVILQVDFSHDKVEEEGVNTRYSGE